MMRVVLLLAFTALFESINGCSIGFREFQGSCYSFNAEDVTWFDAASTCLYYGGRLAQVDSAEKDAWLGAQVSELKLGSVWVGGSSRNHRGIWEWVPSFQRFGSYQNWGPDKPNNFGSEFCLELRVEFNFKWNDRGCLTSNSFICENRPDICTED